MMYSDFLKATATISTEKRDTRHRPDACQHKHVSDVHYYLATSSKGESKFYEAFCEDCHRIVYGRTGVIRIPWTTNRDLAYGEN